MLLGVSDRTAPAMHELATPGVRPQGEPTFQLQPPLFFGATLRTLLRALWTWSETHPAEKSAPRPAAGLVL